MKRFLAWRWWHGWRGWVVFSAVFAVACVIAGFALARAFAPAPDPWSEYPGVSSVPAEEILQNQSTEQLQPKVDAAMREIREAVTEQFGMEWVAHGQDEFVPESNRFGGTSLLTTYSSVNWQTVGTIRDLADKERLVELVKTTMARAGFGEPALKNGMGPDAIADFGGFTLEDQGRWVLAGQPPKVSRGELRLTILDLSTDRTGVLAAQSAEDVERFGYAPEYVSVSYEGRFMLSEQNRAEFERRAARFAGHIAPVPGR